MISRTVHRLLKFVSVAAVISAVVWFYQYTQGKYQIRYFKTTSANGSDLQINVFNAGADEVQVRMSISTSSGTLEDLAVRQSFDDVQEWTVREIIPLAEKQLTAFDGGTKIQQHLISFGDRHRTGGLESLRIDLLDNLRTRVTGALQQGSLPKADSIANAFMQLTDKHALAGLTFPQEVASSDRARAATILADTYSRWERDLERLFDRLASEWKNESASSLLFPSSTFPSNTASDIHSAEICFPIRGHSGMELKAFGSGTTAPVWKTSVWYGDRPGHEVSNDGWLNKNLLLLTYLEYPIWRIIWLPVAGIFILTLFEGMKWPGNLSEVELYKFAQARPTDEELWTEMRRRFSIVEDHVIERLLSASPPVTTTEPLLGQFWRWMRERVSKGVEAKNKDEVRDRLFDYAQSWIMHVSH